MTGNHIGSAAGAAFFIGMTSLAALAAGALEGVWNVKDTAGKPFEITLSNNGAAKATRGEGNDWRLERRRKLSRDYMGYWMDDEDHKRRQSIQKDGLS